MMNLVLGTLWLGAAIAWLGYEPRPAATPKR